MFSAVPRKKYSMPTAGARPVVSSQLLGDLCAGCRLAQFGLAS
jgi:hypothetical protein